MGGRCWGGRLLAARLEELRVAGSRGGLARPTELFAVGRYWRPRWKKNQTTKTKKTNPFRNTLGSDDLPRTIVPRVYTRVLISIYLCLCPAFPTRPVGRVGLEAGRGPVPWSHPGGQGRTRPPLRSADEDGWAGEPRRSAASRFPGPAWERASGQRLWAICPGAVGLSARDWLKHQTSRGARWQCVLAEGLSTLWAGVPLHILAALFLSCPP